MTFHSGWTNNQSVPSHLTRVSYTPSRPPILLGAQCEGGWGGPWPMEVHTLPLVVTTLPHSCLLTLLCVGLSLPVEERILYSKQQQDWNDMHSLLACHIWIIWIQNLALRLTYPCTGWGGCMQCKLHRHPEDVRGDWGSLYSLLYSSSQALKKGR